MFRQAAGEVNQKYKAKFRTLSFNLKDPKNPDLRVKVNHHEIHGADTCKCSRLGQWEKRKPGSRRQGIVPAFLRRICH